MLLTPVFTRVRLVPGSSYQNIGEKGEKFWAGEGGGASGILPVCTKTRRLCLAWRSRNVHIGNCWGTVGGAIQRGMSPAESAIEEMREETGYSGNMQILDAFVFVSGKFRYFNFLGLVDREFAFNPESGYSWETDHIEWMTYEKAREEIEGGRAHMGLKALFEKSQDLIEKAIGYDREKTGLSEETEGENPRLTEYSK
jgi:8-oxo-dGTP pyrophosphatase MutT (NUDIX family)